MSVDRGTINYSAPEVLRGESDYTAACDVYSYGLVLCEMLTNRVPFRGLHEFAIMHRVGVQGERPELGDRPTAASAAAGWTAGPLPEAEAEAAAAAAVCLTQETGVPEAEAGRCRLTPG